MKRMNVTAETLSAAIEALQNNDNSHDLDLLSEQVCEYWEKNGGSVLNTGGLDDALLEAGVYDLPEGFDTEKHNEQFLSDCGFGEFASPKNFPWRGTGDVQWLVSFDLSPEHLARWCAERHAEAEENDAEKKEHERDAAWDRAAYAEMSQEERDAHDNF